MLALFGREFNSFIEIRDGCRIVLLLVRRKSANKISVGKVGLVLYRLPAVADRPVVLLKFHVNQAAFVERTGEIWPKPQSLGLVGKCGLVIAFECVRPAAVAVGSRSFWPQLDHPRVIRYRRVVSSTVKCGVPAFEKFIGSLRFLRPDESAKKE